jgi:hypothetical protein
MNTRFERHRVQWPETTVHEHKFWERWSSVTADNRSWTQGLRDTEFSDQRQLFMNTRFERHRVQWLETDLHEHRVWGHKQDSKVTLSPLIYATWVTHLLHPLFIWIDQKTVWFCEINGIHVLYLSLNSPMLSGSGLSWDCSLSDGGTKEKCEVV